MVEKKKSGGCHRFLLLYGTATGQAKAICEDIADKASLFDLDADVHELDSIGKNFNIEKERCVVIVTSTTGDGDPPPNAEKFMRRIKKKTLASDYLDHFHYALLGLGDSNYTNFNRCARDMDTRLENLGAHKFYPPGFADDGVGLEVVADPWLAGLYPALQSFFGMTPSENVSLTQTVSSVKPKTIKTEDVAADADSVVFDQQLQKLIISSGGDASSDAVKKTSNGASNILLDNEKILSNSSQSQNAVDINNSSRTSNGVNTNGHLSPTSLKPEREITSAQSISSSLSNSAEHSSHNHPTSSVANDASFCNGGTSSNITSSETTAAIVSANKLNTCLATSGTTLPETPVRLLTRHNSGKDDTVQIEQSSGVGQNGCARITSPLSACSPALCDKSLTIPLLPPAYLDLTFEEKEVEFSSLGYQNDCKLPSAASDPVSVAICEAQVLTAPDAVKKTLLLRLSLEGSGITYSPGDSLSIICANNSSEVDLLIDRLQLGQVADLALSISVQKNTKKRRAAVPPHMHPEGSTLRHILQTCVSIRDVPSKAFIRALAEHTTDETELRRMQELCSKEGAQDYTRCVRQGNVTLLDFLYTFPSCTPPVHTVLEHLPRLQPRPYSACSCQETRQDNVDIVFNVVEQVAEYGSHNCYHRRGICTGWLDDITRDWQSGVRGGPIKIPIFVRTNQHFRPPADLSKPVIMIGPGTGVAPFLGFLESRSLGKQKQEASYGETWLFFGCRNKKKDYIFRDRLEGFEKEGTLSKLRVTFSRDNTETDVLLSGNTEEKDETSPDNVSKGGYVQDQMRKDSADLARLLTDDDAFVYVCGDAINMAANVAAVFEDILQKEKDMSKDDAHMFVMKKRIHKTYLEDVWG